MSPPQKNATIAASGICVFVLFLFLSTEAQAHVKWFAPFDVAAQPRPLARILQDGWLWIGIAAAIMALTAAKLVETTPPALWLGRGLGALGRRAAPHAAQVVRLIVAGFFVSLYAIGGTYLTPELHTHHEWVSWTQLLIAVLVLARPTQALGAVLILGLWALALAEYDLFHLLDYVALGLGVAGFLILDARPSHPAHRWRFFALRAGLAVALMWSSLEKFAYPDWFHPVIAEKPFLTFGLPQDMFITSAGIAEFAMGFALMLSPLPRKAAALALLLIFNAAVACFGRMDLIGHALIIAILIATLLGEDEIVPVSAPRFAWRAPAKLVASFCLFAALYWGLHATLYAPGAAPHEHAAQVHRHAAAEPAARVQ